MRLDVSPYMRSSFGNIQNYSFPWILLLKKVPSSKTISLKRWGWRGRIVEPPLHEGLLRAWNTFTVTNWPSLPRLRGFQASKTEKAMAPHSSTFAWKIPWTEGPGGLQSMGLLQSDTTERLLSLFIFMHWRRKWQPTPVFLPGESQGWGSLVGCRLWGRAGSDMTEAT